LYTDCAVQRRELQYELYFTVLLEMKLFGSPHIPDQMRWSHDYNTGCSCYPGCSDICSI